MRPFELEDKPAIPATTLRGLVSSIAEAASNSALRVLEDELYSFRRGMTEGLSAIGMVFRERGEDGDVTYSLLPLTLPNLQIGGGGSIRVPAVLNRVFSTPNLKVYIGNKDSIKNPDYPYRTYTHSEPEYYYLKLNGRAWEANGSFSFDRYLYIKNSRFLLAQTPTIREEPKRLDEIPETQRQHFTRGIIRVLGCWGRNDIPSTKKHELFIPFPEGIEGERRLPILEGAVARFENLADQRTEVSKIPNLLPYEPKDTERNLEPNSPDDHRFRLKPGDLVYFRPSENGLAVAEIALSSIWRGCVETIRNGSTVATTAHTFFRAVDEELVPFDGTRKVITLAEQLFGFVEHREVEQQDAAVALAGRVCFSHARLEGIRRTGSSEWLEPNKGVESPYEQPVTLKILDSPKPPSPSLYFKSARGNARYIAKKEMDPEQHHPQGRKFYLHRRQEDGMTWRTADPTERCEQKATVTPIKPGAVSIFISTLIT